MTANSEKKRENFTKRLIGRLALSRRAKLFVRATKKSDAAAKEVLYHLPGCFAMSLVHQGNEIRLIKEADQFRIMKNSEESDILLTIFFKDTVALCELGAGEVTMQKAFSEGRISFKGPLKCFSTIVRVSEKSDLALFGEDKHTELYGKGTEYHA